MEYLKTGKQISMIFLFFFASILTSRASVSFNGYMIYPKYLVSGSLTVVDPSVKTPFEFDLSVSRPINSNGAFADGAFTVMLMMKPYSYCSGCSTEEIAVSKTRSITNADWVQNRVPLGFMHFNVDAELPVGAKGGLLFLRVTYYNTDQNKILTEDKFYGTSVVNYVPPVIPPVNISDLFTYPLMSKYEIGFKQLTEDIELKWDPSKLSSSTVNINIYEVSTNGFSTIGSTVAIKKMTQMPNNGSYRITAAELSALNVKLSFDTHYSYYMVVEDIVGKKFGKSGLFCFVNEHPSLWPNDFPNINPHVYWIFRPDSSGSGNGSLILRWIADKINASNVSVDLYNRDGTFYRRLIASTPNDGEFFRAEDTTIPMGNAQFYQYKITSVENPSEFGFSEVFNHWID